MNILPEYLKDISREMLNEHELIRKNFSLHHLSAGQNREDILADFLSKHLPSSFGVDTGLILAHTGEFSKEADLVIYDKMYNACLHPDKTKKIFLTESVYNLIEVKTQLNPRDIADAVEKCQRFKTLPREFADFPAPRIKGSIFTLWAFDSPEPETVKKNLCSALDGISVEESPDFVIVPGKFVVSGGSYRSLYKFGQPDTKFRQSLNPEQRSEITKNMIEFFCLNDSLFVWYIWMCSWLRHAGNRCPDLISHVDRKKNWGHMV